MSEGIARSSIGVVPDDVHQSLLVDGSDVETKVGPVAKFHPVGKKHDLEENIVLDEIVHNKKGKETNEFIGLTKEELQSYIDNPKWKRIRWIIAILYILLLVALLVGAILLIIYSQRCPPKPKLVWYEKDIIYEIDVPTFRDSNEDGIGDIKGIQEKLGYLETNQIKSILLRSSIFDVTDGTSLQLDGRTLSNKNIDLLNIDPFVGNDTDLQELTKILNRKDMHLIIDLPLSSTRDPNGYSWFGSSSPLSSPIDNPCRGYNSNLGCRFYTLYGRLPLDFSNPTISDQSDSRIRHWLSTKKIDGIRVSLPLEYNSTTRLYDISYNTINRWNNIKNEIEKKTKAKLFLIDVPFGLQDIINQKDLHDKTTHSLLLFNNNQQQQRPRINAQLLNERIQSFQKNNLSKPLFWQLGSKRRSDDVGIIDENQLSREMILTMGMLFGGTPIVLYGEEIGLNQKLSPLMSWTPDGLYGGFSSCKSYNCTRLLSAYKNNPSRTSVKRQEALGGETKDSLLTVFRHLSKLRQAESFQFGLLEPGYDRQSNHFWFIREAPGHRGYVVLFNLNKTPNEIAHISLYELTKHDVPAHVHYEYQWPKAYLPTSNKTHINADNLFIHPQSINIFWWTPKLIKPKVLLQNAKEHSQAR